MHTTNYFKAVLDVNFHPGVNKGDLVLHDGVNEVALAVGTNGQHLVADSGQADSVLLGAVVLWCDVLGGSGDLSV